MSIPSAEVTSVGHHTELIDTILNKKRLPFEQKSEEGRGGDIQICRTRA
jgi:hypothetical protein